MDSTHSSTPVAKLLRSLHAAASPKCLNQLSKAELTALGRKLRAFVKYMPHDQAVMRVQFKLYTLIQAVAEVMKQQGRSMKQPLSLPRSTRLHGGQYEYEQRDCLICYDKITLLTPEQKAELEEELRELPTMFASQEEEVHTASRRQQLEEWLAGAATTLPCRHNSDYHATCIAHWIQAGNNTCPTCRAIIPVARRAQPRRDMSAEEVMELARGFERDEAEYGTAPETRAFHMYATAGEAFQPVHGARPRADSGEYDFERAEPALTREVLEQYAAQLGRERYLTQVEMRALNNLFRRVDTVAINISPPAALMMEISRLSGGSRCLSAQQLSSLASIFVLYLRGAAAP